MTLLQRYFKSTAITRNLLPEATAAVAAVIGNEALPHSPLLPVQQCSLSCTGQLGQCVAAVPRGAARAVGARAGRRTRGPAANRLQRQCHAIAAHRGGVTRPSPRPRQRQRILRQRQQRQRACPELTVLRRWRRDSRRRTNRCASHRYGAALSRNYRHCLMSWIQLCWDGDRIVEGLACVACSSLGSGRPAAYAGQDGLRRQRRRRDGRRDRQLAAAPIGGRGCGRARGAGRHGSPAPRAGNRTTSSRA